MKFSCPKSETTMLNKSTNFEKHMNSLNVIVTYVLITCHLKYDCDIKVKVQININFYSQKNSYFFVYWMMKHDRNTQTNS